MFIFNYTQTSNFRPISISTDVPDDPDEFPLVIFIQKNKGSSKSNHVLYPIILVVIGHAFLQADTLPPPTVFFPPAFHLLILLHA